MGEFISDIILMIQGYFQCQKINLKLKLANKGFLANTSICTNRNSVIRLFAEILTL